MHATRHGHREEKEPTPKPAATPPPRPTPRHWTLYRQLAHARTVAEHSIRRYTEAAYVEHMLQDWTKYETEVLGGHTGPPGATSRTTCDDIVPDGDIGALATTVRATFGDGSRTDHPFGDNRNPAIMNAILAYYSWSTQQSIHLDTPHDDPHEWHPIGPPALEFYLHEDAEHTTSPASDPQCHNRYRSHTYPPVLRNPKRPRDTNTGPPNKDTAQQPTKRPNPPTPPQPSNNSISL